MDGAPGTGKAGDAGEFRLEPRRGFHQRPGGGKPMAMHCQPLLPQGTVHQRGRLFLTGEHQQRNGNGVNHAGQEHPMDIGS